MFFAAVWYDFCRIKHAGFGGDSKPVVIIGDEKDYRAMEESNLERKLQELVAEFGTSPDPKYSKLAELARQARDSQRKLQRSVDRLQESLDYLRICIKYQIFDLEATRRENKYLRQLLEESKD
jgi:transcriptional antiterminator